MDKTYRIGFLDSGVGGLSVLACAKGFIHNAEYIYYADTDHVPYGTKSHGEIISYVDSAMHFFLSRNVDAVLIACNTATSIAAGIMREKYNFKIIGMEPALKPAAEKHGDGNILVCATQVTITGKKMHDLVEATGVSPDLVALPELVTFAENGVFDKETVGVYLDKAVPEHEKYSAVVLGCTHFTYFRRIFEESFPNAEIIDGNIGAVRRLASLMDIPLSESCIPADDRTEYVISGRKVTEPDLINAFRSYEQRAAEYYTGL